MPLHPALVHFPIALVALAALLQVLVVVLKRIQLTGSVLISLELAALSAVAAALSGTAQEKVVSDLPGIQDSLTLHGMLGNISTWALCVTGLLILYFHLKGRLHPGLLLMVLLAPSALLLVTGHFGAELVYRYGVGVGG